MRTSTYLGFLKLRELKSSHPSMPKLIFFGSEVYGQPTLRSDIDIAIVLDKNSKKYVKEEVYRILEECDFKFEIDLVCVEEVDSSNYYNFDIRRDIFERGWLV